MAWAFFPPLFVLLLFIPDLLVLIKLFFLFSLISMNYLPLPLYGGGWVGVSVYCPPYLLTKSVYASILRSLRKGHTRRTLSLAPRSSSAITISSRSLAAREMISPWHPATKLDPQKSIPSLPPKGFGSNPTRFAAMTGIPLAIAWPRCTVTQESICRSFSPASSAGSHPMADG